MQMELYGGGIKISHPERGQHFLFVGDGYWAGREPRGRTSPFVFIRTDLVVDFCAARGFGY